jgi:hypothetical protein
MPTHQGFRRLGRERRPTTTRTAATPWPRPTTTPSCRSLRSPIGSRRSAGACATSSCGSGAGQRASGCPRRPSTCRRCESWPTKAYATRSWRPGRPRRASTLAARTASSLGGRQSIAVVFYDAALSASASFESDATMNADAFARERILPRLSRPELRGRHAAPGRHRHRRRALRPPPEVPRPLPRPAGQPRRRTRPTAASTSPPSAGSWAATPAGSISRHADRGADLVELPPRRAALVRRVPRRRRRPLEGPAASWPWSGSLPRSTRSPVGSRPDFMEPGRAVAARDEYVDVIFGAETPESFARRWLPLAATEQRERFLS